MEAYPALTNSQQAAILDYLELVPADSPGLSFLEELISAYTRRVPWESAFRIVKRGRTRDLVDCPRWPDEFWTEAIEKGGGGTCFESNYAFFALLISLGYRGYLTINNMGNSTGCHAAIVLKIGGSLWLADVGLPVYRPLPVNAQVKTIRSSRFHRYTVTPEGNKSFQIDRDRHPLPNCYTLINQPVPDAQFRQATTDDYGPEGHFLDQVIVTKVVGELVWRFSSRERPFLLERFEDGKKYTQRLPEGERELAAVVGHRFSIDEDTVCTALQLTRSA
jgi:arylamine N-acetyltransferase